jgi:hypothetical protein
MGILYREARAAAALLVSFTVACVSTGEPLFRDDPGADQPADPEGTSSSAPASTAVTPAPDRVASPEQLVVSELDDAAREAAAAGQDGAGPEVVPAPAPTEPVAFEPCSFGSPILCDTFEDAEENTFPSSASWLPELAGCGSHRVDGTGPSFSGTRALRADDGGYPECMLHADLSDEADVYVRTRVFIGGDETGGDGIDGDDIGGDGPGTGGPGLGGAAPLSQYVSLIEFGSREAQDDPELRIGVRPALDSVCPGVPGVDVSGGGLVGGAGTECTGFVLEPERWYCIEVHLARAGRDLSVSVSVDGTELSARDFTGSAAWATSGLFFKVGRASYGASGRGSLWHDDVAVGREPVPCGP